MTQNEGELSCLTVELCWLEQLKIESYPRYLGFTFAQCDCFGYISQDNIKRFDHHSYNLV